MTHTVFRYNPFDPDVMADPLPYYRVLLVTGFAGEAAEDDLAEARAGGPFAILRKPVTGAMLAEVVSHAVSKRGG